MCVYCKHLIPRAYSVQIAEYIIQAYKNGVFHKVCTGVCWSGEPIQSCVCMYRSGVSIMALVSCFR